jgi:hypothetical protein
MTVSASRSAEQSVRRGRLLRLPCAAAACCGCRPTDTGNGPDNNGPDNNGPDNNGPDNTASRAAVRRADSAWQ